MKEITCILCPRGCKLYLKNNNVEGNFCPRGVLYFKSENENPVRILTSTVHISNRNDFVLPVKTSHPIPKNKLFEVMEIINSISVSAPIKVNDVVYKNVLGLNIDIVATKNIK